MDLTWQEILCASAFWFVIVPIVGISRRYILAKRKDAERRMNRLQWERKAEEARRILKERKPK